MQRIAWKAVRPLLKPFVKNPHREGSIGSIAWKVKWGEPPSEAEKADFDKVKDAIAGTMDHLRPFIEQMPHWLRAPGGHEVLSELIDSLPKPMRKYLDDSTLDDAERNIEGMLRIANYQRERTSIKYAGYALTMSALALLISVITLSATIFIQFSQ